MNLSLSAAGLALVLAGTLVVPLAACAADSSLNGRWAYFTANKPADTDRGPQDDAGCRAFFASDLYDADAGDHLTISDGRWDDNQDVSAVTGDVELGNATGNVTPFTIRIESELADGSGDGVIPGNGTITRLGEITITITISSAQGQKVLHYCRID